MNPAQIRRAVGNLIQNQNQTISNPPKTHPFISTTDLFPKYKYLFNGHALKAFSIQTQQMVHQYNEPTDDRHIAYMLIELLAQLGLKSCQDNPCAQMYVRKYAVVKCFGFTCDYADADDAAKKLITIINDMAASKWVIASMYNIGRIDLNGMNGKPNGQCCITSYLAVPADREADVKATYGWVQFPEGGMPPRFK